MCRLANMPNNPFHLFLIQLNLENEDPVQAEIYINRASLLKKNENGENDELSILYKVCYARVLDYRRKFIDAGQRYNELSYNVHIHETERIEASKLLSFCFSSLNLLMWYVILFFR